MFNTAAECIIDSLMKKDNVICNEKDLQLGTEYFFPEIGVRLWRERAFHPKLLFGGRRHQILPLLRQNGQICDTPLNILGIVDIGRCQLHQMSHAPAYQIAVALQITVLTVGRTEDFGVGHGNRRLFRHDQFCDKNPSNLFWIAICTAANAANRIILLRYPPRRSPPAHPPQEFQSRPCPRCSLHRGQGLLFRPAFSVSAS